MKKYLLASIAAIGLLAFAPVEDIYSLFIKTIDGQKIELSQYRGKKMLFVVLPLSAQDTTIKVKELRALQNKYDTSMIIIGVLSEEVGYNKKDDNKLKKMYDNPKNNFLITEGMKVKKDSSEKQTPIFKWLTNKDKNKHFDNDVRGVGHKFFVDESGELYAVLGPEIRLDNPVIDRILSKPVRLNKHQLVNPKKP